MTTAERLRADLDRLLAEKDRAAAVQRATEAVNSGEIELLDLYSQVLTPLMSDTGAQWQSGKIRVWEEHFATATVRTIIDVLHPHVRTAAATHSGDSRGTVILACPQHEAHDLGLRMLADRFEIAGWKTYFLGADTPTDEILDAARTLGADLAVLSAATHFHRTQVRHVIDALKLAMPSLRVVVGGSAFERERADWPAEELFDPSVIEGA